MLTHQPDFLARHVLGACGTYTLRGTVGDTHAHGSKARHQATFVPRRQLT
jgi:hypothetical protein